MRQRRFDIKRTRGSRKLPLFSRKLCKLPKAVTSLLLSRVENILARHQSYFQKSVMLWIVYDAAALRHGSIKDMTPSQRLVSPHDVDVTL